MNWTGGRLQRHSKANANATLKTQKQHFAKARLQQQNGQPAISPLRLSAFRVPIDHSKQTDQNVHRGVKRKKSSDLRDSEDLRSKRRRSGQGRPTRVNSPNGRSGDHEHTKVPVVPAGSRAQQHSDRESRKSPGAERNTLDAVKRNLLRRSDWMGLNAARPLRMEFPTAEELQNIGRRRKITTDDKMRQGRGQAKSHHYPVANPALRHQQALRQTDDRRVEDPSIRIGSNIHHSQTTPIPSQVQKPASVLGQSQSSESMLLDKEIPAYHQAETTGDIPGDEMPVLIGPIQEITTTSDGRPLLPLEEVRDSKTFDAVKTRSESKGKQTSETQQGKPPSRPKRRAANRSLASDEAKSSSIVVGQRLLESTPSHSRRSDVESQREARKPPTERRQRVAPEVSERLPGDFLLSRHEGEHESEEGIGQLSSRSPTLSNKSSRAVHDDQLNCVPLIRDDNQSEHRPKFTLELQVRQQAQGFEKGENNPSSLGSAARKSRADMASPRSHSCLAESDIRRNPNIVPHGQQSRLTEYLPASDEHNFGLRFTAEVNQRHHGSSSSLSSRMESSLHEEGNKLFDDFSGLCQAREPIPNPAQWRQLPRDYTMVQSPGPSKRPVTHPNDKRGDVKAQDQQEQAWRRFIMQDGQSSIAENFYARPGLRLQGVHPEHHRWPRHHLEDNESLSEDHELHGPDDSNPMPTIKTTANTTIHEFDPNAEARARGRMSPSETDFLSHLSPMEGQLEERLFDASVYTNPARTERGYITAPGSTLGKYEYNFPSDIHKSISTEAHNVSPSQSSLDGIQPHLQGIYRTPSQPSHSRISLKHRLAHRTPLKPISNLFADPQRPLFRSTKRIPHSSRKSFQSSADIDQLTDQEHSGNQWMNPPSSTSLSAPKRLPAFPMNYTPIKHTTKKRGQDHVTVQRHSSSYSTVSGVSHDQNAIHCISHSKSPSHPSATSHVSPSSPQHGDPRLLSLDHARSSNHHHHPDTLLSSTSPQTKSLYSNSYDLPPPLPPPKSRPHSPGPSTFKKPEPLPQTTRAPSATQWQTPHHRSPRRAQHPEPFSTPRPMRKSVLLGPAEWEPFRTPRPMRSRPTTAASLAGEAVLAFTTPGRIR